MYNTISLHTLHIISYVSKVLTLMYLLEVSTSVFEGSIPGIGTTMEIELGVWCHENFFTISGIILLNILTILCQYL